MDNKDKREADNNDMRALLASPLGRRVIRRILNKCHPYITSFNPDIARSAFAEGERNVGLWLKSQIDILDGDAAKTSYHRLMAEPE